MISINGINWKMNNIPERLILKHKQNFKISYLLSKIFLDKNYTDEEIYNSISKNFQNKIEYNNKDFEYASYLLIDNLKKKKKILIFGDYDVDGYSSTYLLYDYFKNQNIDCNYYIPDRLIDGYGPNKLLLKKLIKNNNYGLIIFVDCGTNSINEIKYLEYKGLSVIVIDHHQIHDHKKFKKSIIINPLKNSSFKDSNLFCATSLVYFFIKYLIKIFKTKKKIDLNKYLFFVAIATICDQMPLRRLNKSIVINGLQNFSWNNFINLKKLIKVNHKLRTSDISFTLGPILNSASRLGYPNLPFRFLIENKNTIINKTIKKLLMLNEKRKKIQNKNIDLLNINEDENKNKIIFKFKENINEGLLGIIAAKFVEFYNKPSFILTNSGNVIKCSSRSINGYDIGNIFYLAAKKNIIIRGGGHSMAGGCTLKKDRLNDFKNFLNLYYIKKFNIFENIKFYISEQKLDSLLKFAKQDLQYLEPLGNNNTSPLFFLRSNKIIKIKIINDLHLQLIIKNKNNKSCVCFAFHSIGTKLGHLLMNYKNEIDLIVQINNKIIQKNSDFNLIIKDAIA